MHPPLSIPFDRFDVTYTHSYLNLFRVSISEGITAILNTAGKSTYLASSKLNAASRDHCEASVRREYYAFIKCIAIKLLL